MGPISPIGTPMPLATVNGPLTVLGVTTTDIYPFGPVSLVVVSGDLDLILIGRDILSNPYHVSKTTWDEWPSTFVYDGEAIQLEEFAYQIPHGDPYAPLFPSHSVSDLVAPVALQMGEHLLKCHTPYHSGCLACLGSRPRPPQHFARSMGYWTKVLTAPPGSHWSMDGFTINISDWWSSVTFLLFVDTLSRYVFLDAVPALDAATILASFQHFVEYHAQLGTDIVSIEADQQFTHLILPLQILGVELVVKGTSQHASLAERQIQTVRQLLQRNLYAQPAHLVPLLGEDEPFDYVTALVSAMNECPRDSLDKRSPLDVWLDPLPYLDSVWDGLKVKTHFKPKPELGACILYYPRNKKWYMGTLLSLNDNDKTCKVQRLDVNGPAGTLLLRWDDVVQPAVLDEVNAAIAANPALVAYSPSPASQQLKADLISHCRVEPVEFTWNSPISPRQLLEWFMSATPAMRTVFREEHTKELDEIANNCIEADFTPGMRTLRAKYTFKYRDPENPATSTIKIRLCSPDVRRGRPLAKHYSSPLSQASIRLMLSLTPPSGLDFTVDFTKAYLQSDRLEEPLDLQLVIPSAMHRGSLVWRPVGALYGIRDSGRRWQDALRRRLLAHGFFRGEGLFENVFCLPAIGSTATDFWSAFSSAQCILMVHVDDSFIFVRSMSREVATKIKALIMGEFITGNVSDVPLGDTVKFLGLNITPTLPEAPSPGWTILPAAVPDLSNPGHQAAIRGSLNWQVMCGQPRLSWLAACYKPDDPVHVKALSHLASPVPHHIPSITAETFYISVFCDAGKQRRGVLLCISPALPATGGSCGLLHWASSTLPPTLGSPGAELQALVQGTAILTRFACLLKRCGYLVHCYLYSDAATVIMQVQRDKDLCPPYDRYVPVLRQRFELLDIQLLHLPGAIHPADVLTKANYAKASGEALDSLLMGVFPALDASKPLQ
jgi:hypothetical protein